MAIYHLEAKVVSRGTGRSAVAASAYLSCSKILNDYDGVQHDYTRKKGLVWQEVFLPEFAPSEWKERGVLWNAVEENEKTKDSRLAREFVVALPIELSEAQWEKLLSDFISDTFVADGMCADVAIHDPYPPGHNPHAHIMLTVRPLDEKGNWQYKTQKEYLCVKNGEEQGFTADEFKIAQTEGWEKQYQYKVGRKKVYLPHSEAENHGYERASKHPKSTKFGRQKKILERYCKDHGITAYRHYDEDDGYSGTNFNRPGFQRMLADIKAGRIKRVIVKDMSRFGRDYLQVGMYTDVVFPEFGVHFIAVNDGVDSTRGESEFTAIRNVFNEMYARDTSKKIRATWQSKGKSGEHLTTIPPYGYMKSPEDKKKWIVDEEAAAVVQKIFSLCASGKGPTQIAKWLKQQQILNPTAYCHAKGLPTSNKPTADPYKWTNETVSRILERVDYLGHTVNFKTTKQSYKSKKKIWNDPENWVIFENTQPPIIEESVFLIVQNIRKARRRPTKMGEMGMFSGLLYCAECGGKMYQCRATNFAENQKYFICSTYRKGKDLCTTHSIKNVVLHEIVLRNLREAISYVSEHEAEFIQDAAESDMRDRDAEFVRKRETLAKADTRIAELDRIISRLYEDNVIGKLSDERFIKMSHDYELEQSNLKSMAEVLRKDLKQQEQQKTNVKAFIAAVKKYTDLQELDAAVLRAFIDRIEVSHVDKKSRTREITIVYNFIGAFDFTRAIENARNTSKKEQRTA